MNEISSLQLQLERKVLVLKQHINAIYGALDELKTITEIVFTVTPRNKDEMVAWLQHEAFELNTNGFVVSARLNKLAHARQVPSTALAHHWPGQQKNNLELIYRYYALRNIGKVLQRIRARLGGEPIIYFQDLEHNARLLYPYNATEDLVVPDFQWSQHFSSVSVSPDHNPQRKIQWSPNHIDFAGNGLIATASIPYYQQDQFIGAWSIDVPLQALHEECISDTLADEQVNLIVDYRGRVIAHPSIATRIDQTRGAALQLQLADVLPGGEQIDLAALVQQQKGHLEVAVNQGKKLILVYQIIAEFEWIAIATVPQDVMFETARTRIAEAFDGMKDRQLPEMIDFEVGDELHRLVESYNEMAALLTFNQEKRELAQQQALEAQRKLNEELEKLVQIRTLELHKLNQELARQAQTDPLTGLANRRHFFQLSYQALRLLKREKKTSCLLMIDVDHFKSINDGYGHAMGDEVLVRLSQSVSKLLRGADIFARFGGEEFLVLAPDTELDQVLIMAERIRQAAEQLTCANGIRVTVSIGAADLADNLEDALQKADAALYKAKRNGRNRVQAYEPM